MTKATKIIGLLFILAIVSTAAGIFWRFSRGGELQKTVARSIAEKFTTSTIEVNLIQAALGFTRPQTYLLLFLNNTELRPGGGFIGAYAVVKMENGLPRVVKVEGTEILDNNAPQDFVSVPPAPIQKYLKTNRWNFRDSNWSPDFALSSLQSLALYKKERGVAADDISTVVGLTPTVIEGLLKISGPLTVAGQEFTSDNFTEKLEYEVEYGYARRGLDFKERKKLLADLGSALAEKLRWDIFRNWQSYGRLFTDMLRQKQILIYSTGPQMQSLLSAKDWSGELSAQPGDYLLWADANLGALKTDAALKRELSYSFTPSSQGYSAKATMTYTHAGKFDWRTTRYRTYARVFVPLGTQLIRVVKIADVAKKDVGLEEKIVDQGEENNRQWFGAFISIEPGKTGRLSFEYRLAPEIISEIKGGRYTLLCQKQLGTIAHKLTLQLDFDRKLVSAIPGELASKHGDSRYDYQTDLREDREFAISLEH